MARKAPEDGKAKETLSTCGAHTKKPLLQLRSGTGGDGFLMDIMGEKKEAISPTAATHAQK